MTETAAQFRARMQKLAGITPRSVSRTASSHLVYHSGDRVIDIDDPRHVGRLESVILGMARVTWDNTKWISSIPFENIRRAS